MRARRAVITSGPLNGVEIDPKQAMGNSIILGSVTIVLDANFQDNSCPLARIKKGLEMFVLPRGGEQLGELSLHPGDRMYSVNGRTGTPPGKLQNYTILITGSQDLVLNLGQERKLPASCGSARYIETSHSHVIATIDKKDEETVEFLPLDLELVEATTEYSARLDLLSYITQQTLANIEERLMSDTCIGDPEQLASLLEKASLENDDRVHHFVPAGEVVYRVACPKKRYGATGGGNWRESNSAFCRRRGIPHVMTVVAAVQTSPRPTSRTTDGSTPGLEEDWLSRTPSRRRPSTFDTFSRPAFQT